MPQKRILVVKNTGKRYPIKRVPKPVKTYVKSQIARKFEDQYRHEDITDTACAYDNVYLYQFRPGGNEPDKVELRTIKANMIFKNPASAGAVHLRVIFFQWYSDNEVSVPTATDIFESSLSANNNVTKMLAQESFQFRTKAKLIKDFTLTLGEATSLDAKDQRLKRILITPKMLGRKYVEYTGSTTYVRNAVYCMVISSVANASSPPTIRGNTEVVYRQQSD